ncbi:MAG: helix-turn-helix domain-containing protein [Lachnospiraceae bacterium]|nr:helix-turn-helix domain-containing protein [Lachnospiraceae bacterium]
MININDLIIEGFGDIQISVTLNDLLTFATTLLHGIQNVPAETSESEDELMTRQQVMAYLKIKATTLYNWGKQGILTPRKINRKCYYSKNDILALQRGI